jgi:hypothetical protein
LGWRLNSHPNSLCSHGGEAVSNAFDLLTTSDTHDTGDIVVTMAEGFAYEVAASASHLLTGSRWETT